MTEPVNIVFTIDTEEVIRMEPNGLIFIRGEQVDDNQKVYSAMLSFLSEAGHLTVSEWDDAEDMSIDDLGA